MATAASLVRVEAGALVGRSTVVQERIASRKNTGQSDAADYDEMWRQIYTPLLLPGGTIKPKVLAVSSPLDGEGKTTVALGLATALAKDLHRSILLMDCNLFRSALSESVGAAGELGLANCLAGETSIEVITMRTALRNLSVIPAGPRASNPSRLIRSYAMADLMLDVRSRHDFVVLDMPSMLSSSDTSMLLPYCSSLLLVVRVGFSTVKLVARALSMAERMEGHGIVINDFHSSLPRFLCQMLLST